MNTIEVCFGIVHAATTGEKASDAILPPVERGPGQAGAFHGDRLR